MKRVGLIRSLAQSIKARAMCEFDNVKGSLCPEADRAEGERVATCAG